MFRAILPSLACQQLQLQGFFIWKIHLDHIWQLLTKSLFSPETPFSHISWVCFHSIPQSTIYHKCCSIWSVVKITIYLRVLVVRYSYSSIVLCGIKETMKSFLSWKGKREEKRKFPSSHQEIRARSFDINRLRSSLAGRKWLFRNHSPNWSFSMLLRKS